MSRRKKITIDLPSIDIEDGPPDCPPNCPDPDGGPDEPPDGDKTSTTPALSKETIVYDTLNDLYFRVPDSTDSRMGHFASYTDSVGGSNLSGLSSSGSSSYPRIFVFSGYSGNSNLPNPLLSSCEEMDLITQKWSRIANIPTPRAFGMTVKAGNSIYCIGGIQLDPILNQFVVSKKVESYNVITKSWTLHTDMPADYGVAYGDAQTDGNYIYVVCGFTALAGTNPKTLNDLVLRYSIADDTWISITPVNNNGDEDSRYSRISPFGFRRSTTNDYYICGGSIPKTDAEYTAELESKKARLLKQLRVYIQTSEFITSLDIASQNSYIAQEEERIDTQTRVPAFVYPLTGFRFRLGTESYADNEWTINIGEGIDDEWRIMPSARDDGKAVYLESIDSVFFFGGSNQNISVTLNKAESINLTTGFYSVLSPMGFNPDQTISQERGRIHFAAIPVGTDIYILGGQTSGHKAGYIQVNLQQFPGVIKATGTQSNGFMITLTNDAGELVPGDIRVAVRGNIRIKDVDDRLTSFFAEAAVNRIRSELPVISDTGIQSLTDSQLVALIAKAQNSITNPNSDEFQMNSARKLNEQVYLFPILYSETDILIQNGIGGFILKPRSEDPLSDIKKLSEFIRRLLADTLPDENQKFLGDLTREELASLGDVLNAIELPPTTIDSGAQRTLFDIETTVTVVDEYFFGSSVSDYYESILAKTRTQLEEKIREIYEAGQTDTTTTTTPTNETTFTRYSLTDDIFGYKTEDGQSTSSYSKMPLNVSFRDQLSSIRTTYFNNIDWIPQIKKHLVSSEATIEAGQAVLDVLDHEIPFGSSQLYNALFEIARISGGTSFDNLKKMIYIASDNSENLSFVSRDQAIAEVNSIDGDGKTPVIYTVFSTSQPTTIAAQFERTDRTDIEKITQETEGQSSTLISSDFLNQILNLTIGGATGSLGYGLYKRTIVFDELTAITAMTVTFYLPNNTIGVIRYRYSSDGYNFTDWSERFEGSTACGSDDLCARNIDIVDFFAKAVEFEVVLSTAFTSTEDELSEPTGSPRLDSIILDSSGEKEDFVFLNSEDVLTNVQQAAVGIEGHTPTNAIIEVGVATSISNNWSDFQSDARPILREYGKMFMLERSHDDTSTVPDELLSSIDGYLWTTTYGPWDPAAVATLIKVEQSGTIELMSGFVMYPRSGQVYFDTKQPLDSVFRLSVINDNIIRVGMRLRNRLHSDSIDISGVGYIYSTNDDKPNDLVQLAPVADRLSLTPATPKSTDTFFCSYRYIDPNNDPEDGTLIKWYRNSKVLLELNGKTSWTNDNLQSNNKLQPGDKITFSIQPKDGKDFGIEVFSEPVTISATAPSVSRPIRIVPMKNGLVQGRFDSGSTFHLQYTYVTQDIGPNSLEKNSTIKWYVNGELFKEGTHSSTDNKTSGIMVYAPTENSTGVHQINALIQVEITPRSAAGSEGEVVGSGIFTVVNTRPAITGGKVVIEPSRPVHGTNDITMQPLVINDIDVTNAGQQYTWEREWYKSSDGINYAKVAVGGDGSKVDKSMIKAGERWYAKVRPWDYSDYGDQVQSNTVIVQ